MNNIFDSLRDLLNHLPQSWLDLTTHRLDIYNEAEAKSGFLDELKKLLKSGDYSAETLEQLPTAYDYIRLGHQLSSLLEWVLSEINGVTEKQVITFASKTMPILAVLRKNTLNKRATYIYYDGENSPLLDETRLQQVYGYQYQISRVNHVSDIPNHSDGSVVFVTQSSFDTALNTTANIDATVNIHPHFGCAMVIHNTMIDDFISDIQHVRRRETIAMTPVNCLNALNELVGNKVDTIGFNNNDQKIVEDCILHNTGSQSTPLIASSGLSIQYAILMGLVENAQKQHLNKPIKIVLPPNCYGGTNDQSRRVADLIPNAGIVDLLVDGGEDLVKSLDVALDSVAKEDGVAIVLAEIPTNPRVEVPDMKLLGEVLSTQRFTPSNDAAVEPVFMVDQTFCPNVKLLHQESELNNVKTISFSSGSKFPSGGRCIAGYCAANVVARDLMPLVSKHLELSDNIANSQQIQILAETMPSMPARIIAAYNNTCNLVKHVHQLLPTSKIYYVTEENAQRGFMPSVFSLDLPVAGATLAEHHELQKQLNKKLIKFMIESHPKDCKNCVSYGQLKGSYWTIPATSTQGTTKEDDKDYVVRVALSPDVDVDLLSKSFTQFCKEYVN